MLAPISDRPTLLLLSRVLPSPDGDAAQRAAWSALRDAVTTHRVCLITRAPRRIHLTQWRSLGELVQRVELVPRGWLGFERRWTRAVAALQNELTDAEVRRLEAPDEARLEPVVLTIARGSTGSMKQAA